MSEENHVKAALSKAMALCATHEHCSDDILSRLRSWGLNETESQDVLQRLVSENFVNDRRFAEAFVADKFRQNKWGKVKIGSLLRGKGIPSELVTHALGTIDEDHYRETLKELLEKQKRLIKARSPWELKGKLARFALSRGFESDLVYDLLNDEV